MSLKVFDLECVQGHVFEGWFGSLDSYESQQKRGLLSCPVCSSPEVNKKLSAPRLNVSHIRNAGVGQQTSPASSARNVASPSAAQLAHLQAQVLGRIRQMVRAAENVGDGFADEARRMHEGEAPERAIRGSATPQEQEALIDDGITVMPIPDFLDDDRLQ